MLSRPLAIAAALLITTATGAAAQASPRPWTVGVYVAGSRHSPVGRHWGLTPDRRHLQVGLHATIPIAVHPRWSFRYAPELTPLLVLTNNPTYHRGISESGALTTVEGSPRPVTAFGFAPIGFEGQQRLNGRITLYQAGALGALWFTRQAPVLGSREFNFTFEFGAGVLWRLGPREALRAGYKFHHFSNAKTAPENPGVDAEMFFIGLERTFSRSARTR